jgi:polysaccharide pyruvyl transferase WcaK-like protein
VPLSVDEYDRAADRVVEGELFADQRDAIEACDAVVINGEGSVYDRRRKGRVLLFLAYVAAERLDTPTVLVNHTADVSDPIVREAVATVYPLLDDVVFRAPRSAEACEAFLPGSVVDHPGADAAFRHRPIADRDAWASVVAREEYYGVWPDSAAGFDPGEPYVCVGGSSIFDRPDRPRYDPEPACVSLCRRLERRVAPAVLTAPCPRDARLFRPVADELGLPLIGPRTPVTQAIDVLGNADAYVGGRWHPGVYAATGGTPVVTLTANTYKTAGLVEHLGLDAPTFDALALHRHVSEIASLVEEYVDRGEPLRRRLSERAEELSALATRNVEALPGDAEG